jgi:hypothetical protein
MRTDLYPHPATLIPLPVEKQLNSALRAAADWIPACVCLPGSIILFQQKRLSLILVASLSQRTHIKWNVAGSF